MYYVYVNDINIAVYDLNPSAKKTVLFIHGCTLDIRYLNIKQIYCQNSDIEQFQLI